MKINTEEAGSSSTKGITVVSKALLTCGVSTATVALAVFLGQFTSNIFEKTADVFDQINHGQKVIVQPVISDSDMARLKGIPAEVQKIQEEEAKK